MSLEVQRQLARITIERDRLKEEKQQLEGILQRDREAVAVVLEGTLAKSLELATQERDQYRAKLLTIYPDLEQSGMCSKHREGGPITCLQCFPNYRELCTAHAKVNTDLVKQVRGLELGLEGSKANATCIAKALGDVTEERNQLQLVIAAENKIAVALTSAIAKERDALRLAFAEASHNAGPAFVAHEELTNLKRKFTALQGGETAPKTWNLLIDEVERLLTLVNENQTPKQEAASSPDVVV